MMQELWNFFSVFYIVYHIYWLMDKPNRDKQDEIYKMIKEMEK